MPGIYVHIPFCRQACHYCNFHFSTQLKGMPEMTGALLEELRLRKDFFKNGTILDSLYLGGGTPSLLPVDELARIIAAVQLTHSLSRHAEVTMEANPEDISAEKVAAWRAAGINRISLGIQSLHDNALKYMHRNHSASQALEALETCLESGIGQVSADLIYGVPGLTDSDWAYALQRIADSGVDHISCYALTVEPRTALDHFIRKKNWSAPNEAATAGQFLAASGLLGRCGFDHYEVSNFAAGNAYAVHNTSYWKGHTYLGIGPSAHSFDGNSRYWNFANNARYIRAINAGEITVEGSESLSTADRYNEDFMTGLRPKWGVDLAEIRTTFGQAALQQLEDQLPGIQAGHYTLEGNILRLTREGWLFADEITASLFMA